MLCWGTKTCRSAPNTRRLFVSFPFGVHELTLMPYVRRLCLVSIAMLACHVPAVGAPEAKRAPVTGSDGQHSASGSVGTPHHASSIARKEKPVKTEPTLE